MESNYLWGGTLVGLVLIGLLGVALAKNSNKLREALSPYVGSQPARWFIYGAWFVYGYGLLYALTQAYYPILENTGIDAPPSALSFLYGIVGRSLLWFFSAAVPVLQLIALVVVGILLFRHLKRIDQVSGGEV